MTNHTCIAERCEKPQAVVAGWCDMHYRRLRRAAAPAKPPRVIDCAGCGKSFEALRKDGRFCSRKCLAITMRDSATKVCTVDGCSRPMRAKGLCNMHYKTALRADGRIKAGPWDDRRRDSYHRRLALKKGGGTGRPVRRDQIAERDGYRCGLCHKKVNMMLAWPLSGSPSLDHIVPLTKGGVHDPVNVQLAHLVCNTAKGNRAAGEQLLLIG